MHQSPGKGYGSKEHLTLQELSDRTSVGPRTIRSYIERKLLPASHGQGMRAGYSEKHLDYLNFILKVRRKAQLSLDDIRSLIHSLPEDQIRRVARGEEAVRAIPLSNPTYSMSEAVEPAASEEDPWFSKRRSRTEKKTPTRSPKTWMTAEIAEGLELRQRGHDPEDLKRMTRLAHMLIAWLEEERERETPR